MSVLTTAVPLVQRNYFLWLSLKCHFTWLFLIKTSIRLHTRISRIRNMPLHFSVGRRWAAWWPHSGWRGDDGVLVITGQCSALWKAVISWSAVSVTFSSCPSFTTRGSCFIRLCAVGYLRPRASITSLNNCFKQPRGVNNPLQTHRRVCCHCSGEQCSPPIQRQPVTLSRFHPGRAL